MINFNRKFIPARRFFRKFILWELAVFARFTYRRFRPYVIGITGSSGKTTTRYMVGELLKAVKDKVKIAPGNMNTETGLPLAILGYKTAPDNFLKWLGAILSIPFKALFTFTYENYLVLEYAADKPGDIAYLVKIIPPDIAMITNIGVAHISAFQSIDKIAQEKWKLALSAKQNVICTAEVIKITQNLPRPQAEIKTIGTLNTVRITKLNLFSNKTEFIIHILGKKYKTNYSFFGEHNLENLALAVLAVELVSGERDKIVAKICHLKPQAGRGQRIYSDDILIIDESYNANPLSMLAALCSLKDIKHARKIAILGAMKEIDPISAKSHQEVVNYAKGICDLVIGVGLEMRPTKVDKWYQDVEQLRKEIKDILKKGDAVLIKGSRAVHLDKIVVEIS